MILNNNQMIVENAPKHSVLGFLGARKSGLVFWETLTFVGQSKNTFVGHRMPKNQGLIEVLFE
jgi:hypothetical protein